MTSPGGTPARPGADGSVPTAPRPGAPNGASGRGLPGPAGLAFYTPPAPLSAGPPGQVIWARQMTSAAALPGAASNLLVLYHSVTAGQDTAVSGTVAIPPGAPPAGGWPVLSWAHGTTGVADICAPSRDAPGHPSHLYIQLADAMLNLWVQRGWVVVRTDFAGLGTPDPHQYLEGHSAACGTTDIVTAARQLHPGIGRRWAVMGHNQGGHAALFTASVAPHRAPDLDLIGAVAIAPATGEHDVIARIGEPGVPVRRPGFLALALLGAAAADPGIRLEQLLTPQALRLLAVARIRGIDDLLVLRSRRSPHLTDLFQPGCDPGRLLSVLAANDPAELQLQVPALIAQGTDDPIADPAQITRLMRSLAARGATLDCHLYPGTGHFDVIAAAHTQNARWIDAKLAGMPPAGSQ